LTRPSSYASTSPLVHHHRPPERGLPAPESDELTPAQRLDEAALTQITAALRHTETAPAGEGSQGVSAEHFWAVPVDTLREAVETGEVVWLGYVDSHGESRETVVRVVSVDEGQVFAQDTAGTAITLSVRRISAAHIIRSKG
jgi:hypothetical protein